MTRDDERRDRPPVVVIARHMWRDRLGQDPGGPRPRLVSGGTPYAVVGVLALSSATRNAFGETAMSTLRILEGPSAIVIDNARLSAS